MSILDKQWRTVTLNVVCEGIVMRYRAPGKYTCQWVKDGHVLSEVDWEENGGDLTIDTVIGLESKVRGRGVRPGKGRVETKGDR